MLKKVEEKQFIVCSYLFKLPVYCTTTLPEIAWWQKLYSTLYCSIYLYNIIMHMYKKYNTSFFT